MHKIQQIGIFPDGHTNIESKPSITTLQNRRVIRGRTHLWSDCKETGKRIGSACGKGFCAIIPMIIVIMAISAILGPTLWIVTSYVVPTGINIVQGVATSITTINKNGVILNNALAGPSNIYVDFMAPISPAYNIFVNRTGIFIGMVWISIKPATTASLGLDDENMNAPLDIGSDVLDLFSLWVEFLIDSWASIVVLWNELRNISDLLISGIGRLMCPSGWCNDASICPNGSTLPCKYNSNVFFKLIKNTINWILRRVYYTVLALVNFGIDCLRVAIYTVGTIASGGTWTSLQPVPAGTPSAVDNTPVPADYPELAVFKRILQGIESFLFAQVYFYIRVSRFGLITTDTFVCNIFNAFKDCAVMKVCYTFTTYSVGACIPGTILCLTVHLNFSDICVAFRLFRDSCTAHCNTAIYTDELNYLFRPFSNASAYNCVQVVTDTNVQYRTGCPRFNWYQNSMYRYDANHFTGRCLCSWEGAWVPCIPEQGLCRNSIIPTLASAITLKNL